MLYIFHVDGGVMMTLDMSLALTSVQKLKEVIYEKTMIQVDRQVIMISGGIALQNYDNVCNYSSGTDTNPIFLYDTKRIFEFNPAVLQTPPEPECDEEVRALEAQIKEKVESVSRHPPTHGSSNEYDLLAQSIYKLSNDLYQQCEETVMNQLLQQQGWLAVVANLEDIIEDFQRNYKAFENIYGEYLRKRDARMDILMRLEDDLMLLRKIPLFPALGKYSFKLRKMSNFYSNFKTEDIKKYKDLQEPLEEISLSEDSCRVPSLLDHIAPPPDDLNRVMSDSRTKLLKLFGEFDECMMRKVQTDYHFCIQQYSDTPDMKEIKGLGGRLSHLDSLLRDAKKIMNDLKSTNKQISQTKSKKASGREGSIYPAYSESSEKLLKHVNMNFMKMADIRKRFIRATVELSRHIVYRLNWVLFLQRKIQEADSTMVICNDNVKKLLSDFDSLSQIHYAPKLYYSAVCEVVRRQRFSKRFLQWTKILSAETKEIWENEVIRRKEFANQFTSHFLNNIFPGLKDIPPDFATEKPLEFDQCLPKLSPQCTEALSYFVPEMKHMLIIEDSPAVPPIIEAGLRNYENANTFNPSSHGKEATSAEIFASAVTSAPRDSERTTPERTDVRITSPRQTNTSRPSSFIRDQPESETDTEEFEKVCASISDGTYSPLENVPDNKSAKTKHPFPCSPSDSKHIKLDSSHIPLSSLAGTSYKLDSDAVKKSTSPSECIVSPTLQMSPEEFVSRDFYIDESMPSSYTESTATATTTSSGARHHSHVHHHPHRKSHHVITAELQKQIEEKNVALLTLKDELGNSRSQVENLQARLNTLAQLSYDTVLTDLRNEMEKLKDQVRDDGSSYKTYINELSARILGVLERIQLETEMNKELAVKSALSVAQLEEDERRNTLKAQLIDTNRELEIYQEQTRDYITQIELLKCRMKEESIQLIAEKEECVKKLTLEHVLEMESLKEYWSKEDHKRVEEVTYLNEKISELELLLTKTVDEKNDLDKELHIKYEAKLKETEEKIEKLVGDKSDLEKQKRELEEAFNTEKRKLLEEHQENLKSNLENLRHTLKLEVEEKMMREHKEIEERHNEELMRCRELWEAQKEEEVEGKKEELKNQLKIEYEQKLEEAKHKYKMELDGLRSRFRMMTTASMDKSPSETSLEKFERGDYVETNYHDLMLAKLREELMVEKEKALDELSKSLKHKFEMMIEEERIKNEDKRREEVKRIEAEKQEMFSAAFKEVTHDKERVIEDLRLRVEFLTDETEKLRKSNAKAQENVLVLQQSLPLDMQAWQERCEAYKKEVDRLEREVERAKRLSFVSEKHPEMCTDDIPSSSSSSTVTSEISGVEFHKLQTENKELRAALGRASAERKKVSLDDAQLHDLVLVVWDESYEQYRILLENQPVLHFLHSDSYGPLGLTKGADRPEKLYCTAQVIKKKEFCQAKRDGNRFRVPKGTKFYRVEAGPVGGAGGAASRQEREVAEASAESSLVSHFRREGVVRRPSINVGTSPLPHSPSSATTAAVGAAAASAQTTPTSSSTATSTTAIHRQETSPDCSEGRSISSTP